MMVEMAVRLIVAGLLGALVGIQRQAVHKPAGLRTHALVALGACAFAEISHATGDDRIAAGVITGIGFLGAGAIVRAGMTAHGLTTAASIWSAAAIGLAAGSGVRMGYDVDVEYRREAGRTIATLGYAIVLRSRDSVARVLAVMAGHDGIELARMDDEIATS
jgi:hypothetical protein